MTGLNVIDPDLRAEAVRTLIRRSGSEDVPLAALAGADLCMLGGPRHAVFPEATAKAWLQFDERERGEYIRSATDRLVRKGLLIEKPGQAEYAMSPELGVILASRCRPAYAVVVESDGLSVPVLSMFALGDEREPVRAVAVESLAHIAGDPAKRGVRPLTCGYAYVLVSPQRAGQLLADMVIRPVDKLHRWSKEPGRVVTRFTPVDARGRIGQRLKVRGNGTAARVAGWDSGNPDAARDYARPELEAAMAGFLEGAMP
jgi:hypothetical protein